MKALSVLLVFICVGMHLQASQAGVETDEVPAVTAIWALEEEYVACFRDATHDKAISMWHDRFLGWPSDEIRPTDKTAVVRYLKRNASKPADWSFKIEKSGIQVHGNVAITHFIIHRTYNPALGTNRTISSRVTHTWVKENLRWKILGGMSTRH